MNNTMLRDHVHNLIVPHFDAPPICRLCGLTEQQIINITLENNKA